MITVSPIAHVTTRPRLASLAEVRDLPAWRDSMQHLVKDHRYHEIVADTLGFQCGALVLEDGTGAVLAVQPCFVAEQDLLMAAPAGLRALAGAIRRVLPRFLRVKMLMVGCAAGEGHLTAPPIEQMQRGLQDFAVEAGAWLIVWKDIPSHYRGELRGLKDLPTHCAHIASMPAARLTLDFDCFEDYLARRLSHSMRKNLRRKFRKAAEAAPLTMTVTADLGEDVDEALALYEQVFARSKLQFERLTKGFLEQLAERMPERVRFFLWRQEGRLVAFSLCFVHDGVLYDEYLGLDYRVALDLHLYFITFRDMVTWALGEGLTAYHSTPLNYEPKLHLGFELIPLDLYFALPWAGLNRLARPILSRMSPTRAEPTLARFANAGDLATGA
jgi:hypothetical protein